eukprot:6211084-Pleurochrysis_carterae.AAC.1
MVCNWFSSDPSPFPAQAGRGGLVSAKQILFPPPVSDINAVRKCTKERGFSLEYNSLFEHSLDKAAFKAVCPPRKKELGTRPRCVGPMPCLLFIFERGLRRSEGCPS